MNPENKKNEEAIFNEAIRIKSDSQRLEFIKSACGKDAALLARIEALLKVHFENKSFLNSPPVPVGTTLDVPLTEGPGTTIGRYKLLQMIGEGGFGVVYMAEQQEPIRRKVALKIIKLGMDTSQVIARFEAERQALAMMDHPNIAKVFDAGSTDTGRPYFVMELVKGIPITDYCDKHNFSTRQRLELFIDVCKAVQHAHQKGIIHRDVKPSNVLITLHDGKPVPKIIDFGIAKATQQRLTEKTLFTEFRQFIGTPEYMSPEQAEMSGLDIDTRSDIYSLGVLLYELLTGTTPFKADKLRSFAYDEIRRIIREDEPPKPSMRLSTLGDSLTDIAKHRDVLPAELRKIVRGDLDWVVMKTLEKDRTRRYETASELAADIERHLTNRPVSAGPPGAFYRIGKFIRRHRTGVAAGLLTAAAIIAGLTFSSIMFLKTQQALKLEAAAHAEAKRQAAISQAVNNFLNDDLLSSLNPAIAKGREITVMEVLDNAARKIEDKFKDAPEIEASIRDTLGMTYFSLGKFKPAELHLNRALELRQSLFGKDNPDTLKSMHNLGMVYEQQKRYKEAESLLAGALQGRRKVLGDKNPDTLKSMAQLGWVYWWMENYKKVEPLWVEAINTGRQVLGKEHPDMVRYMGNLGWLYCMQRRYKEAEPLFTDALKISTRVLGQEHPDTLWCMNNLGWLYSETGRYEQAEPLLVKAMEGNRKVLGEEHSETLYSIQYLSRLYDRQGRFDEAQSLLTRTLEIQRRILGDDDPKVQNSLFELGKVYWMNGRFREAEPLLIRTLETQRQVLGEENPTTLETNLMLGWIYSMQGRYDEAEPLFVKTQEISRRTLGEDNTTTIGTMVGLGWIYKEQGRYEQAEPLLLKSVEGLGQKLGEEHPYTLVAASFLGELYYAQGRFDDAQPLFIEALDGIRLAFVAKKLDMLRPIANITKLPEFAGLLGIERYKAKEYEEAFILLKSADEYRRIVTGRQSTCETAYLAMSLQRLGRQQEAKAALERLNDLLKDEKAKTCFAEAQNLINGK